MTIDRLRSTVAALVVTVHLASACVAWAGDLCIDASGGQPPFLENPIIIGRSFKLPKKNKCKPFNGVVVGFRSAVTGTACASADGTQVTMSLVASLLRPEIGTVSHVSNYVVGIEVSTLVGEVRRQFSDGNASIRPAQVYECKKIFPGNQSLPL